MKLIKTHYLEILVVLFFLVSRIPDLGHDSFTTDTFKWKARSYDFGSGVFGLDFEKTIQKYHPGVTLMWLGSFGIKFYNFYFETILKMSPTDNAVSTIFGLDAVQKTLIVLTIAIALAFIFYALRHLFGVTYAVLAIFLIGVEPLFVGLSRVMHLEGLMSTFMLASFVWLYFYAQDFSKKWRLLLSAFFGGLAILTKTSSIFIIPFAGLFFLLYTRDYKFSIKEGFKWFGLVVLFFVLLWPAMLTNPVQALEALYRGIFTIGVERGHEQIYFGRFMEDPGFTFYPVVFFLRSTPQFLIGLIGYLFIYKKLDLSKRKFAFYALLFSFLYFVQIELPSKKLDRYLLPSILSLVLVGIFFYERLIVKYGKVVFMILLFMGILPLFIVHPDYFSYFNPMFGGLRTGIKVLEPKWLIGEEEIVGKLAELKKVNNLESFNSGENLDKLLNTPHLDKKLTVGFQEKYYTQIWPFVREIGGWPIIQDLTPYAVQTKYFVYPVWDDSGLLEDRFELKLVDVVKIRGVEVYRIYERI